MGRLTLGGARHSFADNLDQTDPGALDETTDGCILPELPKEIFCALGAVR